ncbi:MAG: DUF819 family protein [Sulfurovaceae bacterium]|nr:DUF819 family protein [Sulfurovaceae bacterium]
MIENSLLYIVSLIFIIAIIILAEKQKWFKFFEWIPSIVLIYVTIMVAASLGLWKQNKEIDTTYSTIKNIFLPAMIFLMLLNANIKEVLKLGRKMLGTFFLATSTIMIGFVISFLIFKSYLGADGWKSLAALSGSWIGGTGNMIAIQGALKVPDTYMGFVLLTDSINYALWVMILLALIPFADRFNKWSGANTKDIDEVGLRLSKNENITMVSFESILIMLGISLMIAYISQELSVLLPTTSFLSTSTWVVMIATIAGIAAGMTSLSKIGGGNELAFTFLYIIVGLIASKASITDFSSAPFYVLSGTTVLLVHLILMLIFAKLFKLDLFSLGVASLANIGGVGSAPLLAGAYSKALVPIGVLMAMLGYIVGTAGGLIVGKILQMLL